MTDLTGQTIDRYQINESLGQGGMATVYRAYDTRLEREVAIKLIRTEIFGQTLLEQVLKRFEREARALAKLDHPNIVHVYDYGEYRGAPYLVMQYLSGGTLNQRSGYRMPFQEAATLLAPVADALAFAHDAGVIHRDVKPANILTTQDGQPMLTDFGIAKMLESQQTAQLTGKGMGVGTPDYMAPEQWNGQVFPQTDMYSLGVVFYELVTGVRPFVADTPAAVLIKAVSEPLPPPRIHVPDLPEAVERLIFKVLAKNPAQRYENMKQFAAALSRLASGDVSVRGAVQTITDLQQLTVPQGYAPNVIPPIMTAPPLQTLSQSQVPPRQPISTPQPPRQSLPRSRPLPKQAPPSDRPSKKGAFFRSQSFLYGALALVFGVICLGAAGVAYQTGLLDTIIGGKSALGVEAQTVLEAGVIQTLTAKAVIQPGADESDPAANPPVPTQTQTETPEPPAVVTQSPVESSIAPTATTNSLRDSAQVYWDLSHIPRRGSDGSYEPSGVFSSLTSALQGASINVQTGSNSVASLNLDQYDVVVISATSSYESPYSAAEAAAVGEFVERGGGLIILAEDSSFTNNIVEVAAYFNISVAVSTGIYDVSTDSSQSITEGISALYFYNGGSVKTGSTEYAFIQQTVGSGRLVVIGDSNLFDNRWLTKANNQSFALNVFLWTGFMKE
jgi:serine/threonine protein kinase